jgi:hypothetical protein
MHSRTATSSTATVPAIPGALIVGTQTNTLNAQDQRHKDGHQHG